jgi:alkylation response protein AidB-like acyl-CoA dehydrogenase
MLTHDALAFRSEVCEFLTSELTPAVRAAHYDEREYLGWDPEFRRDFRRKLGARGYLGVGWPSEYGGGGRDMLHQVLYLEEIEYHGAPAVEPATTYVPYVLMTFGSEEQKRALLPRFRSGDLSIFLGYSEPEAGSDLANLSTTATPDADAYILNGQKSYSSWANIADYGLVAARAPGSTRHNGISLFLVDMRTPGISIARHRTIAGFDHPSVHFESVRVPATNVVGSPGEGWRCLMGAIDFERASLGAPGLLSRQMFRLVTYAHDAMHGGLLPIDDPVVCDRIVGVGVEHEAARLMSYELATKHSHGQPLPPTAASVSILLKREAARAADVVGLELLGPVGQLHSTSPYALMGGAIEQEYREHLYFHFAAGGFDITRNVVAVRALGLPR